MVALKAMLNAAHNGYQGQLQGLCIISLPTQCVPVHHNRLLHLNRKGNGKQITYCINSLLRLHLQPRGLTYMYFLFDPGFGGLSWHIEHQETTNYIHV